MAQYVVGLGADKTGLVMMKNTSAAPETTSNWSAVDGEVRVGKTDIGEIESVWADVGPYSYIEEEAGQVAPVSNLYDFGRISTNVEKQAQSFQVSNAISCVGVWVKLIKIGSPTDNVQVSIQADSSGDPSGTPLKSATIDGSTLDSGTGTRRWFGWAAESLSASTTYWIVLERSSTLSDTNYYRVRSHAAYASGSREEYYSAAWNTASNDLYFAVVAVDTADHIHVVTCSDAHRLAYHAFKLSTDAWVRTDEVIPKENDTDFPSHASLAVRSNGEIVVLSNVSTDVDYALRNGGYWTVAQEVFGTNGSEGLVCVLGASDRVHFLIGAVSDACYHRSLSSANVLDTLDALTVTKPSNIWSPQRGVADSADNISVPVQRVSDSKVLLLEFASGANPTITENAAVTDNTVEVGVGAAIVCCAVDGTDVYTAYANDADQDIYYDENDGSDTEAVNGVTCNRLSANVYTRSGQKLGIVYLDGTTIKYEEVDIAGGAPEEPPVGGLSLMGVGR